MDCKETLLRADELETQIWGAEGFKIRLLRDGKDVRGDASGFASYPFHARLPDSKTVSEWKQGRLSRTYPGYTAEVLNGDNGHVHGNTLLRVVRESYDS